MAPIPFSLAEQSLGNTIGASLLGVVGAAMLSGAIMIQAYFYYHTYPHDTPLHKSLVALLWLLDVLHLGLTVHTVYTYAVLGFHNPAALAYITWSMKLQVSINVVIIVIVHSLYALRVWRLGDFHRGFLGYIVIGVVAVGFVIGVVLAYLIYTVDMYSQLASISWIITAALGTSTAIDFVITGAMCYYLKKSKGSLTRLNSRISNLIHYTLGSGLFTSACSLSALFCYHLLPNTFVFLALEFMLTKLYVSSFLAMLNSRDRKESGGATYDDPCSPTSLSLAWQQIKIQTATSSFWSPRPPSTAVTTVGNPAMTMTTEFGTIPASQIRQPFAY
jgi:hypothetical protein